jgi:hypothetical protein
MEREPKVGFVSVISTLVSKQHRAGDRLPLVTAMLGLVQQGRQAQEVGFPTLGTERSAEWRGRNAAEVCTSEARKIGVPFFARQGRSPSAGLVSLRQRETQRLLSFWFRHQGAGFAGGY